MSFLDKARTRYKSLPPPLRAVIGNVAKLAPESLRFGKRHAQARQIIGAARRNSDFAGQLPQDLLSAQLQRAFEHSPFYREAFERVGLTVSDMARIDRETLTRLPIITKDEVRQKPDALLTRPTAELDLVTTSGSSGEPMQFYLDRDRSVVEWAFLLDAWEQVGFRSGDKRAALRGFEIANVDTRPWEYEQGLRELRLSPFHMNADWLPRYVEEIGRRRIAVLHGYPSAIEMELSD